MAQLVSRDGGGGGSGGEGSGGGTVHRVLLGRVVKCADSALEMLGKQLQTGGRGGDCRRSSGGGDLLQLMEGFTCDLEMFWYQAKRFLPPPPAATAAVFPP